MRIFHQNMQNYSGGNGIAANGLRTRNAQFDRDFANIQNAMGGPSVLVAGFTELLNNTTTVGAIAARAAALDPTLTNLVVIGVGITVIGARDEYIGIAWDSNNFTIQNGGQVLFNSMNKRWECHNTAAPLPATIPTPGFVPGRKRKADSTEAAIPAASPMSTAPTTVTRASSRTCTTCTRWATPRARSPRSTA